MSQSAGTGRATRRPGTALCRSTRHSGTTVSTHCACPAHSSACRLSGVKTHCVCYTPSCPPTPLTSSRSPTTTEMTSACDRSPYVARSLLCRVGITGGSAGVRPPVHCANPPLIFSHFALGVNCNPASFSPYEIACEIHFFYTKP